MFISRNERAEYDEAFINDIVTAPMGVAVVINAEAYGIWCIIRRLDVFEAEEWRFDWHRFEIMQGLGLPKFHEEISAYAATLTVEENRSAIRSYRPARLTFDF
jgi:hypothetical protein